MKPPALLLLAAAFAMPDAAFAQDDPAPEPNAEAVLRAYHERIERALRHPIACGGLGDEIVVCGRSS